VWEVQVNAGHLLHEERSADTNEAHLLTLAGEMEMGVKYVIP